ncbi:M4 family metallopeptidase [Massilia sp. R2A-15]|uniref:M4 family metallopeptidase n=1 Tax=Massilia sp. R2A-15 TaxID=3064278 RepID=UPI002736A701|nr:M4 family metallopeptidase [Massilia sp. R2A-15]WLI90557.1 M4 family metallopeptidase [Massilia sp. R2A-15]
MTLRKTLLAATIAALPLMMSGAAQAAAPAGNPAMQAQDNANMMSQLMSQRGRNGLDSRHGFALGNQHPGAGGTTISRLDHTFKGVRVYGSESVVVTGAHGNVISESAANRRAGLTKGDFNVAPGLSAKAAIDGVVARVSPNGKPIDPPSAELIIYPVITEERIASAAGKAEKDLNATDLQEVVTGYQLAYLVKTRHVSGNTPQFYNTIVSATDGSVIDQWSMVQTVVGTGNSQYNGAVPINTTLSGSTYSMKDTTRGVGGTFGGMAITNANHTTSAGAIYTNTVNTWGDGQNYIAGGSTTNANGQTAAVNAAWGLQNTYDMLNNTLGWKSLDGNNTATYIAAHVNTAYDNAYYSDTCKCMYIGDGGTSFTSLGSIDVIGHEMGHGVTAATSNLAYRAESGGLNESASDIQGEMVEAYARAGGTGALIPAGNDWMMGKEIAKNGQPLRWLYKPSKDGASPNAWSSSIKRLDVHYSSGPNNRMFYFLSQGSSSSPTSDYYSSYLNKAPLAMTGIGNDKAFRIWFKALTTKFTSATNYADARLKVIAAAQELYGVGSAEDKAVQRAYAAINVGADVAE